jgi:hypothetical protein
MSPSPFFFIVSSSFSVHSWSALEPVKENGTTALTVRQVYPFGNNTALRKRKEKSVDEAAYHEGAA